MRKATLIGLLSFSLGSCAELGDFATGYNEAYQQNQASWDSFDQEQAIQRVQWDQQRQYNQERFDRSIDRIREGIGP